MEEASPPEVGHCQVVRAPRAQFSGHVFVEVDGSGVCVAQCHQDVVGGVGSRDNVVQADRQGGDLACPPAAQGAAQSRRSAASCSRPSLSQGAAGQTYVCKQYLSEVAAQ